MWMDMCLSRIRRRPKGWFFGVTRRSNGIEVEKLYPILCQLIMTFIVPKWNPLPQWHSPLTKYHIPWGLFLLKSSPPAASGDNLARSKFYLIDLKNMDSLPPAMPLPSPHTVYKSSKQLQLAYPSPNQTLILEMVPRRVKRVFLYDWNKPEVELSTTSFERPPMSPRLFLLIS